MNGTKITPPLNKQGRFNDENKAALWTVLSCAVYFSSYLTRLVYAACVSAIREDIGASKGLAGLAVTGAFVTYGLGQLISGVLGDRFRPQRIISVGLLMTSVCNFLIPMMPNVYAMTVVWCFNGFFQSMLWPPLVKVMSIVFDAEGYKKACVRVSLASSLATVVIYLLVPVCIEASGWRLAFIVTGAMGTSICAIWSVVTSKLSYSENKAAEAEKKASVATVFKAEFLLPIMLAIALQGMLRDGITTWVPSYISEVFELKTSSSILTSVVIPIFSFVSLWLAAQVNRKLTGERRCATLFFGVACASALLLMPLFNASAALSVLLMAIITGCAHGINLMLVCNLPGTLTKYGKVSTVSGLLNTFTYIGSAVSTYGFAALADSKGWFFTVGSWALTAFLGGALCLLAMWKKKDFKS